MYIYIYIIVSYLYRVVCYMYISILWISKICNNILTWTYTYMNIYIYICMHRYNILCFFFGSWAAGASDPCANQGIWNLRSMKYGLKRSSRRKLTSKCVNWFLHFLLVPPPTSFVWQWRHRSCIESLQMLKLPWRRFFQSHHCWLLSSLGRGPTSFWSCDNPKWLWNRSRQFPLVCAWCDQSTGRNAGNICSLQRMLMRSRAGDGESMNEWTNQPEMQWM